MNVSNDRSTDERRLDRGLIEGASWRCGQRSDHCEQDGFASFLASEERVEENVQKTTHKVWPSRLLSICHLHVVDSEVEELVHRFEGARERHVVFQLDGHDLARQRLECAEDELF